MYPALSPSTPPGVQPSAPPLPDEGYDSSGNSRGIVRPHSISPFTRNVRSKGDEEEQMDVEAAISTLVSFSNTRREISTVSTFGEEDVAVRTFSTSTPTTPAAAPRPEHPPRIVSRRVLPLDTPRPRPLHRASAALGAPPRDGNESSSEEEGELPDIPESPASPTYSDITVRRLVYFF
uniref:Uncharacterized protein LOC111110901 n=1 Tax=Crassostrea virginica TaxID=6565 RepID=A0A8B8BK14_CRAVI|nr:uncharacterized protein LOC111110901 [Crassostrea virginica]